MDGTREKWAMGSIQMERMRYVSRLKGANLITNYLQKRDMKRSFTKGQNATT